MKKTILVTLCTVMLTGIFAGCAASPEPAIEEAAFLIEQTAPAEVDEPQKTTEPDIQTMAEIRPKTDEKAVKEENEEAAEATPAAKPEKEAVTAPAPKQEEKTETKETPKPQETKKPAATATLEIEAPEQTGSPAPEKPSEPESAKPEPTLQPEKPAPAPTVEPTPEPVPEPTPEPQPEMEVMGGGFNQSVLAGVNEIRAQNGNTPLTLDSGLCAKALAHAKEMAKRGEAFHACGGAESVSTSSSGGKSIGIRSAAHATGLALDADRSRLGVGSVRIGDKQYTCVFAPRD